MPGERGRRIQSFRGEHLPLHRGSRTGGERRSPIVWLFFYAGEEEWPLLLSKVQVAHLVLLRIGCPLCTCIQIRFQYTVVLVEKHSSMFNICTKVLIQLSITQAHKYSLTNRTIYKYNMLSPA